MSEQTYQKLSVLFLFQQFSESCPVLRYRLYHFHRLHSCPPLALDQPARENSLSYCQKSILATEVPNLAYSNEKRDVEHALEWQRLEFKPDVRCVGRDVVLAPRIKVLFWPFHSRFYSLVLSPQFPPLGIVIPISNFATEHLPSPLIDQKPERQESDFTQRHLHKSVNVGFWEGENNVKWEELCDPNFQDYKNGDTSFIRKQASWTKTKRWRVFLQW